MGVRVGVKGLGAAGRSEGADRVQEDGPTPAARGSKRNNDDDDDDDESKCTNSDVQSRNARDRGEGRLGAPCWSRTLLQGGDFCPRPSSSQPIFLSFNHQPSTRMSAENHPIAQEKSHAQEESFKATHSGTVTPVFTRVRPLRLGRPP